jgi:azurin
VYNIRGKGLLTFQHIGIKLAKLLGHNGIIGISWDIPSIVEDNYLEHHYFPKNLNLLLEH